MKRLKSLLSKILQIDEDKINDKTSPANTETWDSFNGLLIASELEKVFKVKFTMEEVTSVKCVGDIKASLKQHGVDLIE